MRWVNHLFTLPPVTETVSQLWTLSWLRFGARCRNAVDVLLVETVATGFVVVFFGTNLFVVVSYLVHLLRRLFALAVIQRRDSVTVVV